MKKQIPVLFIAFLIFNSTLSTFGINIAEHCAFVTDSAIFKNSNGKICIVDEAGKALSKRCFDRVLPVYDDMIGVSVGGKSGFVDIKRNLVLPLQYDNVTSFNEGVAGVKLNGKWGLVDKNGKLIIGFKYDSVLIYNEGYISAKKKLKWGIIDLKDNIVIPFMYDMVKGYYRGVASLVLLYPGYERSKLVDVNKNIIQWDWSNPYRPYDMFVEKRIKWILAKKKVVTNKVYDAPPPVEELREYDPMGKSSVGQNVKLPKIKPSDIYIFGRKNIVAAGCDSAWEFPTMFNKTYFGVRKNGKIGVQHITKGIIIDPKFDNIDYLSENRFKVGKINAQKNALYALFDDKSKQISDFKYTEIYSFANSYAIADSTGKRCLINISGQEIIPLESQNIHFYTQDFFFLQGFMAPNLIGVEKNKKVGFYNLKGQLIVPFDYAEHRQLAYYDGCAIILNSIRENRQALLDVMDGKFLTPFIYYDIYHIGVNRFKVYTIEKKWGIIDNKGQTITPAVYDNLDHYTWGQCSFMDGNKWGTLDMSGKVIIPAKFDDRVVFKFGIAEVKENGKAALIDLLGNKIE
jgi:hypothetical protein